MAKKKIREVLAAFAISVSEKQKRAFVDSLFLHYQNLSPFTSDEVAPNYQAVFEKVMEFVEDVAPTEITTYRYAPETVAPPTPMSDEERDLCERFCDAASRYCYKIPSLRRRFFTEEFQDAFQSAIIVHYATFGSTAFLHDSEYSARLLACSKTARKELRAIDRQKQKAAPDAFDFDVAAPDASLESSTALNEALAFLASLKPRKFDPLLIAIFGSARDGLAYLNPDADLALKRALERERCQIQELLAKRFSVDDK